MHMRETMISITIEMIDVAAEMAGGGEEAMAVGVVARRGMEEDTLGKGLEAVVIMVAVVMAEDTVVEVVVMVAVTEAVGDTEVTEGKSIGDIEPGDVELGDVMTG